MVEMINCCTLISLRKTRLESLKCAVGPSGKLIIIRASTKSIFRKPSTQKVKHQHKNDTIEALKHTMRRKEMNIENL